MEFHLVRGMIHKTQDPRHDVTSGYSSPQTVQDRSVTGVDLLVECNCNWHWCTAATRLSKDGAETRSLQRVPLSTSSGGKLPDFFVQNIHFYYKAEVASVFFLYVRFAMRKMRQVALPAHPPEM